MRRALALALLAAAGCGAQPQLLGTRGAHLLTVYDALAAPGEQVDVAARLRGGDFLQDRPGYVVRFGRQGRLFKAAETDEDGRAAVAFTPETPGDYRFVAEVAPVGFAAGTPPPRPQELLVACRPRDAPIAVVDLDRTLVATGFQTVLVGDPEPMGGSVEVMRRLAREYAVVYLTHRPDFFGIKSRTWLREQGYPRGPVLLSSVSGFLAGSESYKSEAIRRLAERFTALRVGIGDKISDAAAYHARGLHSVLVFQVPDSEDPEDYTDLAMALGRLPEAVDVVTDWDEVARAVFEGARFPARRIEQRLEQRARELKRGGAGAAKGDAP